MTAKPPRAIHGNIKKIVQTKCAGDVPFLWAVHANFATIAKGTIANAKRRDVRTKADVRCSGRVSFSANPKKNQRAAAKDRSVAKLARPNAIKSAGRPVGGDAGSSLAIGVNLSSVMLIGLEMNMRAVT